MEEGIVPTSKEGSLLEREAANLFKRWGFRAQWNIKKVIDDLDYQIDVWVVTPDNHNIMVECKQRRDETEVLSRNFLHEVSDKLRKVGADKAILITNSQVPAEHKRVFKKDGVTVWDFEEWNRMSQIGDADEFKEDLYKQLGLEEQGRFSLSLDWLSLFNFGGSFGTNFGKGLIYGVLGLAIIFVVLLLISSLSNPLGLLIIFLILIILWFVQARKQKGGESMPSKKKLINPVSNAEKQVKANLKNTEKGIKKILGK